MGAVRPRRIPFWIYEDHARGLALIRGRSVDPLLDVVLDARNRARWSLVGKGWVMPIAVAADIAAAAEVEGVPYRVKQVEAT